MFETQDRDGLTQIERTGIDALYDMLNHYVRVRWVVDAMLKWHPTLQQTFTKLCYEWLTSLANIDPVYIDDRNKKSYGYAREVSEKVGKWDFPLI